MEKLIEIYQELYDSGVTLIDRTLNFSSGSKSAVICLNDCKSYGVFIDSSGSTISEETVMIAHEAGHIATGSTHKMCSPYDVIGKHERRADIWAIKKLIPEDELEAAFKHGIVEVWELAEHFNVTEDFIRKAVEYYRMMEVS